MTRLCPNCQHAVSGNYCAHCGQPTREPRGPLLAIIGEFFTEFLSLDGRHLRTAARLGNPGRLTQLYLEGKRASYVPPVRVYFVASLLFFLLIGFPAMNADDYNVYVNDMLIGRDEPGTGIGDLRLTSAPYRSPRIEELQRMSAQQLLDRILAGLERTVPVTLIFFVPVLALALTLLYVRQPFFYVDHLIFALHFQSFLFLALLLARFSNRLWPAPTAYLAASFLILLVYMLLALKRIYGQSWTWTVLKCLLLGFLYLLLVQPLIAVTLFLIVRAL